MTLQPAPGRNPHLARSTAIVVLAFAAAKLISLAQVFIIARVFGVSSEYDAFVTANKIPEQIYTLIAGGAVAFAFIPVFAGLLANEARETAWRTASYVVNTIFTVTFAVSLVAFIFAPYLVRNVVAPGFPPDVQAQTAELMRILLVSTLIFSISGISMGILQSFNLFLLPALAPILFDVGILFGVAFLIPIFGVHGIALGAVLGAALHLGIQVPGILRVRARWTPRLGWNDPHLRRILTLMIPRVLDLGVIAISTVVTANILSRLGTGAASAFDWGWRLMQIPETLIGTAMGVVIFPTLAALSSLGDVEGKRDAMSGAVRFILIGTIPSAVGLIVVGRPLISLLERGAFDSSASDLVYGALQFFALGIVVHSILEIIARSFYADKDTLTPLIAALGGFAINVIAALVFTGILVPGQTPVATPMSVGGLALANTLGVTFEVVMLGIVLRRRWRSIHENALAVTAAKTLAASLVMAVVAVAVGGVVTAIAAPGQSFTLTVVQLALQVGLGVLAFIATALVLRMDELKTLLALILRRRPYAEVAAH